MKLENGPHKKYLRTLNLFAYGTFKQYSENTEDFLELTEAMKKKLQHLTIVSMAVHTKNIPYTDLLDQLGMLIVRDLEDLIIEAIYSGELYLLMY